MNSMEGAILDFKRLDLLAAGDTGLHRLDPRAKVLVTALFVVLVVSRGRYEISALVPFLLFPAVMTAAGNLPPGYLAGKILLLSPFIIFVGLFNPLFDRAIVVQLGPIDISGGWLSFGSIMLKSLLTVGSALVLLALTGFPALCRALEQLGMPRAFAVQLLFLYRYLFVLAEEAGRAVRARKLRSCGTRGDGMGSFATLVGHLLLRTWQRAERVHVAMLSRGFDGGFPASRKTSFGWRECLFVVGWGVVLFLLRCTNLSHRLGTMVMGGSP